MVNSNCVHKIFGMSTQINNVGFHIIDYFFHGSIIFHKLNIGKLCLFINIICLSFQIKIGHFTLISKYSLQINFEYYFLLSKFY